MEQDKNLNRRSFLMKILIGSGAILGSVTMIPFVGALIAPLLRKTPAVWRTIGKVDDFEVGKTVLVKFKNSKPLPWTGLASETASWLRRKSEDEFDAFTINCAHLGCPVRWEADAELFLCPCHGGVYNKDGSYAAGPPPHGLPKYPVRVRNKMVEIQTSPLPITNLRG